MDDKAYIFYSKISSSLLYYVPNTQSSLAVITARGKSNIVIAGYIQDFTKSMCSTQASSAAVYVEDRRDGQIYTVRYINGNCWMVQNLRYVGDTGSTSTSMIMKADTSNISTDQNLTIGDLTSGDDYNEARIHVATSDQVPSGASYTATDMGVWYNYAAASAGYVTSNKNSTVESTESVCPKNWRLPTNSEMSGITSYQSAFFNDKTAVTGGNYNGGTVVNTGNGYWWSSTPNSSNSYNRYYLYYNGSSLGTANYYRGSGFYVRCVRDMDTMQSVTADKISSMSDGGTVELEDARDNNVYTTRKINGKLWMVQNLRYIGDTGSTTTTMKMKAATSNISTDQNLTIGDLTSGNDYDNARIHVATSDQVPSGASYTATDMGVWYNYTAASAGYVTSTKNSTVESTESVCPKNWRLPTNSEMSGIRSYQSAFFNGGSAVTGGRYSGGSVTNTGYGFWWSSTPYSSDSNGRYRLRYYGSSLDTGSGYRYGGFYVRCIHN